MNMVKVNAILGVITIVMSALLLMNEDTGLGPEWNGLPLMMLAAVVIMVGVFSLLYWHASHNGAAPVQPGKAKSRPARGKSGK